MALPPPTPPLKTIFTLHTKYCFHLSVYICEKPASLAYQDRNSYRIKLMYKKIR